MSVLQKFTRWAAPPKAADWIHERNKTITCVALQNTQIVYVDFFFFNESSSRVNHAFFFWLCLVVLEEYRWAGGTRGNWSAFQSGLLSLLGDVTGQCCRSQQTKTWLRLESIKTEIGSRLLEVEIRSRLYMSKKKKYRYTNNLLTKRFADLLWGDSSVAKVVQFQVKTLKASWGGLQVFG